MLIAGDDARLLDAVAAILSPHATVVSCASARRALDAAEREPFDVVCADADMVSMTAVELFRKLMGVLGHVGYLLITSPATYAGAAADMRWHVVFKPIDADKLSAAVLQLSRLAQMRRTVADLARVRRG